MRHIETFISLVNLRTRVYYKYVRVALQKEGEDCWASQIGCFPYRVGIVHKIGTAAKPARFHLHGIQSNYFFFGPYLILFRLFGLSGSGHFCLGRDTPPAQQYLIRADLRRRRVNSRKGKLTSRVTLALDRITALNTGSSIIDRPTCQRGTAFPSGIKLAPASISIALLISIQDNHPQNIPSLTNVLPAEPILSP